MVWLSSSASACRYNQWSDLPPVQWSLCYRGVKIAWIGTAWERVEKLGNWKCRKTSTFPSCYWCRIFFNHKNFTCSPSSAASLGAMSNIPANDKLIERGASQVSILEAAMICRSVKICGFLCRILGFYQSPLAPLESYFFPCGPSQIHVIILVFSATFCSLVFLTWEWKRVTPISVLPPIYLHTRVINLQTNIYSPKN